MVRGGAGLSISNDSLFRAGRAQGRAVTTMSELRGNGPDADPPGIRDDGGAEGWWPLGKPLRGEAGKWFKLEGRVKGFRRARTGGARGTRPSKRQNRSTAEAHSGNGRRGAFCNPRLLQFCLASERETSLVCGRVQGPPNFWSFCGVAGGGIGKTNSTRIVELRVPETIWVLVRGVAGGGSKYFPRIGKWRVPRTNWTRRRHEERIRNLVAGSPKCDRSV
jgi:hypothetical protein